MLAPIKNQKGSAIVEVAIIFPLMLVITLAFIYFIELSRVGVVMEAAATEGAREFHINPGVENAKAKAIEVLQLGHVSVVGDGFYSIEVDTESKTVTIKRKVIAIPYFGNLEMKRSAQYREREEHLYYGKGIYGPGYTGNPY
jgi:ABC-type uncharacterized transport system permease subunit